MCEKRWKRALSSDQDGVSHPAYVNQASQLAKTDRVAEPVVSDRLEPVSALTLERLYAAAVTAGSDSERALLQEIQDLGSCPKEIRKPASEDERKEQLLRKRLNNRKLSQSQEAQ